MRYEISITSKTAGYNNSNPMAVALRNAMAKRYGFTSSDDPFEFQRQLIEAKARAIAADMEAKNKSREIERLNAVKADELAAKLQAQNGYINQIHEHRQRSQNSRVFAGGLAPLSARKKPRESTAETIQRLSHLLDMAEARDQRRKFGKWGRAYINAETPESDFATIRRQHQSQPDRQKEVVNERELLIDELQRLDAFAGEFMLHYNVHELRRALRRAKSLRGIAESIAAAVPSGEINKPISFDGYSIGEDERDRVVFTIRRMRAQLPRNWERCSLLDLLNHLRHVCTTQGRKWFTELWPTGQPVPSVLPLIAKVGPAPAPVDPAVERLWKAIFGSVGAGQWGRGLNRRIRFFARLSKERHPSSTS